jgi:hypothetical protein
MRLASGEEPEHSLNLPAGAGQLEAHTRGLLTAGFREDRPCRGRQLDPLTMSAGPKNTMRTVPRTRKGPKG